MIQALQRQRNHDGGDEMPNFFLIQGALGAGKTLTASILAHSWRVRSGGDVRIFANYDLAQSTPFDSIDRWIEVAEARGSACIWDEAQWQFDRRLWARNTFNTQIFNLTRKLRTVHMFINPIGDNLDSRILSLVEVFAHVTMQRGTGITIDLYEFQDKRFGQWGRPMNRLRIPWWKVKQIFKLELYDTDQLVFPFPSPKTEREEKNVLEAIINAQQRAAQHEKQLARGAKQNGWINPSDHYSERVQELEEEESSESSLPIPFNPESDTSQAVHSLALRANARAGGSVIEIDGKIRRSKATIDVRD